MVVDFALIVAYTFCSEDIWWELKVMDVLTMEKSEHQLSNFSYGYTSFHYLLSHGDNGLSSNLQLGIGHFCFIVDE
jgi:hypothetical protein